MKKHKKYIFCFIFAISFSLFLFYKCYSKYTNGDRVVYYANMFIGKPYDRIPEGLYVKERKLIMDKEMDCMYFVFRTISLALSNGDDKQAEKILCNKMFKHKCKLDKDGFVINYNDRFEYGEDMILSGKYGKSIFNKKETSVMKGSRMYKNFNFVKSDDFIQNKYLQKKVKNGDILFLYKHPDKRSKANEAVGHLGVLEVDKNGIIYFIHASGSKNITKIQGAVKKVKLIEYLKEMNNFIGIDIVRF